MRDSIVSGVSVYARAYGLPLADMVEERVGRRDPERE